MYKIINKITIALLTLSVFMFSCKDLDEMNENPNGVDTESGEAYLFISTVITYTGAEVVDLGFGDLAGVMQHTQKDGWSGSHNSYDWDDFDWSDYYTTLRNTQEMMDIAEEDGLEFYTGAGLVMKALNFGMLTDLWGDIPFSNALLGEDGVLQASYDDQEDVYAGILEYLDEANTLLSKDEDEYDGINETQDLLYEGDVTQWQKLANSLALRYYMRLSEKDPETAQAGIEKIAGDQATYPLMLDASDDADYEYVGNSDDDSWPSTIEFDESESNFSRIQMCSTLIEKLQELNDPRLGVWAAKVEIPTEIDATKEDNYNEVVDGVRIIAQNVADEFYETYGYEINTDPEYVGLPPAWSAAAYLYNLNEGASQGDYNPYASQLNDIYKESTGDLLKARIMTAAEVNFILAEAALKGWSVGGSASDYYYAAIQASFDAWDLSDSYDDYIQESGVVYDGTVKQIMEQKWISSWTSAAEAWFDWRRTGYPELEAGPVAARTALPIRFYYGSDELYYNADNTDTAIESLVETDYTSSDGKNSSWSKMWLLQGTDNPY